MHEGLHGGDDHRRAGLPAGQAGTQSQPFRGDLVGGRPFAGGGFEGAEQLWSLPAEQLDIVDGLVGLVEVGGDIEQGAAKLCRQGRRQDARKGSPQPVRGNHPLARLLAAGVWADLADSGQQGTEGAVAGQPIDDFNHTTMVSGSAGWGKAVTR